MFITAWFALPLIEKSPLSRGWGGHGGKHRIGVWENFKLNLRQNEEARAIVAGAVPGCFASHSKVEKARELAWRFSCALSNRSSIVFPGPLDGHEI